MWTIISYCLYSFIINILLDKHALPLKLSLFTYSSFTAFEYCFFTYFMYSKINNGGFKRLILVLSSAFIIFSSIYYFLERGETIDSIPIGIETIFVLLYCFYYLYEQMKNTDTLFIYNTSTFWVVVGLMIYLSGSFFIYIFANQSKEALHYWYFTNIFSILKDILFVLAIVINARTKEIEKKIKVNYLFDFN